MIQIHYAIYQNRKKYKMKESLYNIKCRNENGELLIYNSLNEKIVKINSKDANEVEKAMSDSDLIDGLNSFYLSELTKYNMLVENNSDEIYIANKRYLQMAFGGEVLDITIIPTVDCNFGCVYCYEKHEKKYMNKDTISNIIKYFKKNMRFYKKIIISWFGGEPLLATNIIIDIMKELSHLSKKYGTVIVSMITTNGYNLTADTVKALYDVGVRNYQITVDGTDNIHNKQRPLSDGGKTFDIIFNNLRNIRDKCKDVRYSIALRINISREIDNVRHEFLSLFKNEFGDDKHFSLMFEWIRNWSGSSDDIATTADICYPWLNEAVSMGIQCYEILSNSCGLYFCEACKKNGYIIQYDGTVHKCTLAIENMDYKNVNCIGRIDSLGNMQIDEKKECRWILNKSIRSECELCKYFPMCMGINCPWATQIRNERICLPHKNLFKNYILAKDKLGKSIMLEGKNDRE